METEPFVLRMAMPGDALRLLAVYTPHVLHGTASWEYAPPTEIEFARRILCVRTAGFAWLVAERHGAVLGYAYAGRYGARRGYDFTAETSIYLDPAATGQGVGRALYTALLALLRAQGYVSVFARITHPNPGSEAFHTAMGFSCVCCLPDVGYKLGQWLGLAHYRLTLRDLPKAKDATSAVPPPVAVDALPLQTLAAALRVHCGAFD